MATIPQPERQFVAAVALAWRDFLHEWRMSACLIWALAAVLAPLLVLFGLKYGMVTTLSERLRADPVNREVVIRGHYVLPPEWFEALRTSERVGFVVPRTRRLSATMTLEAAAGRSVADLDLVPTAGGDPLLPPGMGPPVGMHEIVLTHTAAAQLDAVVGTPLHGVVARRRDGQSEAQRLPLTVRGILPETAFGRDAAFVSLPLLVALEDYRDGFAVAELGVDAGTPARAGARPFASARVYARELDDVAPLAERLRGEGIEVVTRAREIETVKAIDRTLTLLFTVLAAIATVGYVVSLAASLWASVDRKRREIALLRLVGLGTAAVIGFPAVQAALVAAGGLLLSVAAYGGVAAIFNWTFATYLGREELVCALRLRHIAIAAGLTLACALGASIFGGYRATRIDPAESLREL